jgi:enoyl-CoA hydratase/carnithine racemase
VADDDVIVARDDRVLRVTVNRPRKHNALSRAVLARLRAALDAARGDDGIRCVVITGAGERYFAAGGDLHDLGLVRAEPEVREMSEEARAALDAVRRFPVPVIALLNGDAIGGGAELALACDLRVMRDGARVGYIHGRLAITPAWGGGADLIAVVGPARALGMMARAEMVPAATALQWGLVDAIAAADQLEPALAQFLGPMLQQSRRVLEGCKRQTLAARAGLAFDARRALELEAFVETWTHADHWDAADRILRRDGE